MRRLVPVLPALLLLLLLPTPLIAASIGAAGVVLHALMPISLVFIIYAVTLRDLP